MFESAAQHKFQQWRDAYFPPERNIVPAHLTLFHKLPAEERPQIETDLADVTQSGQWEALATDVHNIGRGFAVGAACVPLEDARHELASRWQPWLSPQDGQRFRPHVVIQNKTTAEDARTSLAAFTAAWRPFSTRIVALALWTYLGGPWRLEREFKLPS